MSSATSIETFRPWHFFVLASLMAATAAVIMSRQSTPEHLILVSLTIAAAGFAAAGFYRMLAPLAESDTLAVSEQPLSDRLRSTLEREKALALRAIKELEFDRAMGKVSAKDFDEMAGRLRTRAMGLMKQLDQRDPGYRALIEQDLTARLAQRKPSDKTAVSAADGCSGCGTVNDADARFCKGCGQRLAES
jgi:hypothetical protein